MRLRRKSASEPSAEVVALAGVVAEFRQLLLAIEHMDPCGNAQCNSLRRDLVLMAKRLPEVHAADESESR